MKNDLILKKEITINAPVEKVWEALTDPAQIKKYFFGSETITDWKKGSPIIYRGIWEGTPYEDKGVITDIVKDKFIHYTYWSSFSGTADIPENYANISYTLSSSPEGTTLTITQDGFATHDKLRHSEDNWGQVLDNIRKLLEQ
jgi:uncharacterized protein YndB with AHSA1/START domain